MDDYKEHLPDEALAQYKEEGVMNPQYILSAFVLHLKSLLEEQSGLRRDVEDRWVEDIKQYRGIDLRSRVNGESGDKVSADELRGRRANKTRTKTNMAVARFGDLMFPNSEENWAIRAPTEADISALGFDRNNQETFDAALDDLQRRHKRMESTLRDQLAEGHYVRECREAIQHAGQLGTGIVKGPVTYSKDRVFWAWNNTIEDYQAQHIATVRPMAQVVHPFDFYPDMSASCLEECEFTFERIKLSRRKLRRLHKTRGFDANGVRRALQAGPRASHIVSAQLDEDRRNLGELTNGLDRKSFEVFEYHGPVSSDVMQAFGFELDEDDPLQEQDCVAWFCGDELLDLIVNPMDSEAWPYSVWTWEDDDTSLFGYGVPYLSRQSQQAIHDAWYDMMDNADKSAGSQIVVNKRAISPNNGQWAITRNKVWSMTEKIQEVGHAFQLYDIPNHQTAFEAIYKLSTQLMDEETGLPQIMQGEQGTATPTMGGTAMLMNAANAVLRRQVRRWDEVTKETIGRWYDYNMQFGEDPSIKADLEVEARGTSTLLVSEIMSQHLMMLLSNFSGHPVLASLLKSDKILRKLLQANHLDPNELVLTEDELKEMQEQAQEQPQGPTPEELEYKSKEVALEVELQKIELAYRQQDIELEKAASNERVALYKLQQEGQLKREELQAKLDGLALRVKETRERNQLDLYKHQTEIKTKMAMGSGI